MAIGRLNPVAWTEGMFLRPQHFQHNDRYVEERLRYHLSTLTPYFWGVRSLTINEDQLSANTFEIEHLEAVMPSGLVVRTGDNALVEPRAFEPDRESLSVYLALRSVGETESAMTAELGEGDHVRYEVRGRDLADRTRVGAVAPIEVGYPKLRLFFSGEDKELELYERFKIADIVASGEKTRFALSPDYCPPLLATQASPPLQEKINRVVAQLRGRLTMIAGRTSGTLAVAELPLYWMRYSLASSIPMIDHLTSTGATNPFQLYTSLVEVAAALSAFNQDGAADLPAYDHLDLMRCFSDLLAFIEAQQEKAAPSRFTRVDVAFDPESKLYQTAALNSDLVSPRNAFYLVVKADLEMQDLVDRMTRDAKAGALSSVKLGLRANLAGVPIEHMAAPPTEVEILAGYQYFRLDPRNPKWKKIQEDYDFALSLPNVESADVRLYVVQGEA